LDCLTTLQRNIENKTIHITQKIIIERKTKNCPQISTNLSRYCDITKKCKETLLKGKKYVNETSELSRLIQEPDRLCPPPKGEWNINFSQTVKAEDIPDGFFGPIQSVMILFCDFSYNLCILERILDQFQTDRYDKPGIGLWKNLARRLQISRVRPGKNLLARRYDF